MISHEKILLILMFFLKYTYGKVSYDDYKRFFNTLVLKELDRYEAGNYSFEEGTTFKIYKPNQDEDDFDINGKSERLVVRQIEEQENCLGLVTHISETIVLDCPVVQAKEPGCFYIFSKVQSDYGKVSDETKVDKACVEVLNERCIGIVTPSDWILPLSCTKSSSLVNS